MNAQNEKMLFKCKEDECQVFREMGPDEFQNEYKSSLTVLNISSLYEYFKCQKNNCEGVDFEIYFPRDTLVLDSRNIQLCKQCNNPISEIRKKTLPGSNICSARCIEKADEQDKVLYQESHKPVIIKDKCPRHKETLVERYDRFGGLFFGCPKYPFCFYTKSNLSNAEEIQSEKTNVEIQKPPKVSPIINPPKLEKRIWGSALSLSNQARKFYNEKKIEELVKIKNELEYRVLKRKKFGQSPWQPTIEALEYVKNLIVDTN